MKFAAINFKTRLGMCSLNKESIEEQIQRVSNDDIDFILLAPLSITGYTCGELFTFPFFLEKQKEYLDKIILPDKVTCLTSIMTPQGERPYAFNKKGEVDLSKLKEQGINLCLQIEEAIDDAWNFMPIAHVWTIGSKQTFANQLKNKKVVFCSCGQGESTESKVYSGICGVIYDQQILMKQNQSVVFNGETNDFVSITNRELFDEPMLPFVTTDKHALQEAFDILSTGLKRRLEHISSEKVVLGISGGLDSTLALIICHMSVVDKKNIVGITMPGFGTSERTKNNALILMEKLGVSGLSIPIVDQVTNHLAEIGQDISEHNIVFENAQARERTQILMDYANKIGGINVGGSDMSEAMLGFSTFGGDGISMYNVLGGVPKTLAKQMLAYAKDIYPNCAELFEDILDTPISPELLPGVQSTEDFLGKYIYHDFYMFHTLVGKLGKEQISKLFQEVFKKPAVNLDLFYSRMVMAQFKRNSAPDSPQLLSVSLNKKTFDLPSDISNVF